MDIFHTFSGGVKLKAFENDSSRIKIKRPQVIRVTLYKSTILLCLVCIENQFVKN